MEFFQIPNKQLDDPPSQMQRWRRPIPTKNVHYATNFRPTETYTNFLFKRNSESPRQCFREQGVQQGESIQSLRERLEQTNQQISQIKSQLKKYPIREMAKPDTSFLRNADAFYSGTGKSASIVQRARFSPSKLETYEETPKRSPIQKAAVNMFTSLDSARKVLRPNFSI